jgi:hypothetical protein
MKPECWPCICLIAAQERIQIKGCWLAQTSSILYS